MRAFLFIIIGSSSSISYAQTLNQPDDGFRGIWYYIGKTNNEYVHKYSGGLGNLSHNHSSASYGPVANKTFFCYGGASKDSTQVYCTKLPTLIIRQNKCLDQPLFWTKTDDAHDNPVLNIDARGCIFGCFLTSHGTDRPSYIHRSRKP
ncbi:MAG: hypothetical protein R2822_05590 [Spirosomataceae bacterium]